MNYAPLRVLVATLFHLSWKSDDRPLSEQDVIVLRRDGLVLGSLVPEANDVAESVQQLLRLPQIQEVSVASLPRTEDEIEGFALQLQSFVQALDDMVARAWIGCSTVLTVSREVILVETSQSGRGKPQEGAGFRVSIATIPSTIDPVEETGRDIIDVAERAIGELRKRLKKEEDAFVQT